VDECNGWSISSLQKSLRPRSQSVASPTTDYGVKIFVHVPSQTLDLIDDNGKLVRRFACSTSKFGLGFEPGSNCTPTGNFRIAEKHGDGAPEGMIFKSRVPTGKFGSEEDEADHVQTRILWLDGLDKANANTKSRYIYIHGTNAESSLGTPASHGCVRMANLDIAELYEIVPLETPVEISDRNALPRFARSVESLDRLARHADSARLCHALLQLLVARMWENPRFLTGSPGEKSRLCMISRASHGIASVRIASWAARRFPFSTRVESGRMRT
jgi:L,D-transpeptidase YbiS